jgi:hypothetical protein
MLDNILDGDDGVGILGNDAAGRDRHRLARCERAPCGPPRGDLRHDGQRAGEVSSTNGEAVHRRAAERGQVDKRLRSLRRDAARGLLDRHSLTREHVRTGEHERLRLLQGE